MDFQRNILLINEALFLKKMKLLVILLLINLQLTLFLVELPSFSKSIHAGTY